MTAIRVTSDPRTPRRRASGTAADRFWLYANQTDTCWLWTGSFDRDGYGRISVAGWPHTAHRFAYELLVGPIPEGLHLDHLCRVRHCVNPAHLEAVTPRENVLRAQKALGIGAFATHCVRGHFYDEANTGVWNGHRHCRTCARETMRAKRRTAREAEA